MEISQLSIRPILTKATRFIWLMGKARSGEGKPAVIDIVNEISLTESLCFVAVSLGYWEGRGLSRDPPTIPRTPGELGVMVYPPVVRTRGPLRGSTFATPPDPPVKGPS